MALDGFHVHRQCLRPVLQGCVVRRMLLDMQADLQQAGIGRFRQVQRQRIHPSQFVQQQAHHTAIAAVVLVWTLDQAGSQQQFAQQGGHLYREGFGRQVWRELRLHIQAAHVHLGNAVHRMGNACRYPDRTGGRHYPAADLRAHHHQPGLCIDQLVTAVLVRRDMGAGLVMAGTAGHRPLYRHLPPGSGFADRAGDVLFAIGHDQNAAEGREVQP